MQAYELTRTGGIEGLALVERPIQTPGVGEVLVRIGAVSLNRRDIIILAGGYGSKQKSPVIPASDCAGTVEAVGPGVSRFRVGDRVLNSFLPEWLSGPPDGKVLWRAPGGMVDGVLCEYRVFPESGLVRVPEHLSDVAAATLACAGTTAWSAVVKFGGTAPGSVVLIQGSGGVSLFALQLAKLAGARVIATSSSDEKLAKLRTLGADETINYRSTPDWGERARGLTHGRGVDLVVDVAGGETLNESIRAVRVGGTITAVGVLAGPAKSPRLPLIAMRQIRLQGIACGSVEDCGALADAVALHRLQPVVDKVFGFAEAPHAFSYLAGSQHFGKVAIAVN